MLISPNEYNEGLTYVGRCTEALQMNPNVPITYAELNPLIHTGREYNCDNQAGPFMNKVRVLQRKLAESRGGNISGGVTYNGLPNLYVTNLRGENSAIAYCPNGLPDAIAARIRFEDEDGESGALESEPSTPPMSDDEMVPMSEDETEGGRRRNRQLESMLKKNMRPKDAGNIHEDLQRQSGAKVDNVNLQEGYFEEFKILDSHAAREARGQVDDYGPDVSRKYNRRLKSRIIFFTELDPYTAEPIFDRIVQSYTSKPWGYGLNEVILVCMFDVDLINRTTRYNEVKTVTVQDM